MKTHTCTSFIFKYPYPIYILSSNGNTVRKTEKIKWCLQMELSVQAAFTNSKVYTETPGLIKASCFQQMQHHTTIEGSCLNNLDHALTVLHVAATALITWSTLLCYDGFEYGKHVPTHDPAQWSLVLTSNSKLITGQQALASSNDCLDLVCTLIIYPNMYVTSDLNTCRAQWGYLHAEVSIACQWLHCPSAFPRRYPREACGWPHASLAKHAHTL